MASTVATLEKSAIEHLAKAEASVIAEASRVFARRSPRAVEQTSILAKAEASVTAEAGRVQQTAELAKAYVADLTGRASVRANQLKSKTVDTVSDPQVQVTAAAAVAGAATLGTAAGTAGVVVGGVVGAVVGIVPALFTFGLSIPVFAAVGAAVGGGTGVTVGGTTGLVGGGAAGYYGYAHKDEIRQGAGCAYEKLNTQLSTYQAYATGKVSETTSFVTCKVRQLHPGKAASPRRK